MDFIAGFSLLFLVGSVLMAGGVLTFSILAPLFMSGTTQVKPIGKYVRITERSYDFDED